MKTVLSYILHVIKLIFTLGIPAYNEVAKKDEEIESLIVGVNVLISEAKTIKAVTEKDGNYEGFKAFADPDRIKRIMNNAQQAYGAANRIKDVLKKLILKGRIKKVN